MTTTLTDDHTPDCTNPRLNQWQGHLGDLMQTCHTCHKVSHAAATTTATRDRATSRRWRLICVRCDAVIYLSKPKARTPLCQTCTDQ